jgi:hypothetical protein
VRNVAQPVIRRAYAVYCLDGAGPRTTAGHPAENAAENPASAVPA